MTAKVFKVVDVQDHPNADSLKVYQMVSDVLKENSKTVGDNDINFEHVPKIQIVANLSNIYNYNDNVKVVLANSVMKDGTKIKETKIRGVLSNGMALGKTDLEVGTDLTNELCIEEKPVEEDELDKTIKFVKWPSIEQLHNVRRYLSSFNGEKKVTYHGKIKLHGTCSGITIKNGTFRCQKRTSLISVESDNAGFCKWAVARKDYFNSLKLNGVTIFGEFAGPAVQKGVAIAQIPNKSFCVFALQYPGEILDINPETIKKTLGELPPDMYVLPFQGDPIDLDFTSITDLNESLVKINNIIEEIDNEDPWVKEVFDISGVGEGLVYYPISECQRVDGKLLISRDVLSNYFFKAKGDKHQVVKQKKPVQIDPEVAKNVKEFVEMFVTDNRLNQIANEVGIDIKNVGTFMGAFMKDVGKESVAELGNLNKKTVYKEIGNKARLWFLKQINERYEK